MTSQVERLQNAAHKLLALSQVSSVRIVPGVFAHRYHAAMTADTLEAIADIFEELADNIFNDIAMATDDIVITPDDSLGRIKDYIRDFHVADIRGAILRAEKV